MGARNGRPKAPVLLFVDDDYNWAFIFRKEFQLLAPRWEIVYSREGEDALSQIAKISPPNALVTDLFMPGMCGIKLIEWIKNQPQFRHLPIVVLSNSEEAAHRQRCAALGVDSYLIKPSSLAELRKCIRYIVRLCEGGSTQLTDWEGMACA